MAGIKWEKDDPNKPTSAISCATACYKNDQCEQGWSYQQATQRCLFISANISTEEMDKLQPYGHIMETDKTIGWATGLKACWQTRESHILLIFSLMSRTGLCRVYVVLGEVNVEKKRLYSSFPMFIIFVFSKCRWRLE